MRTLQNAVRNDTVGHAYLFSGPRGTGKTSSARILAKALNCERPVDGEPCCECASCVSVEAGVSYDVHELDAASNNGVDAMRDLIEKTMLGTPGRHKVYILDEVHMLSKAAEAALLKTLEEPPAHVVFVLATTDPQKVSETIRSRCQALQFHLLAAEEMEAHIKWVIADAGLDVDPAAIEAVIRQGGGSVRDTLSALDQVVAAGGVIDEADPSDELLEALADSDTAQALAAIATAIGSGRDARTLTEQLVRHLRDAFLSLMAPDLVQLPEQSAARIGEQARRLGPAATVRALEILGETLVEFRHAPDPRLLLDIALVRLTNVDADTTPGALLARLERLERAVAASPDMSAAAPAVSASSAPRATLGARSRPSAAVPPVEAPAAKTPPAAAAPAVATEPPTRDQLTLAWADQVWPKLKGTTKALFSSGRFVASEDGEPTFALPSNHPMARCEQMKPEVEAALSVHFARPVTMTLSVDHGETETPTSGSSPRPPAARAPEPEEAIDPDELVDAPLNAAPPPSGIDRLADAFPGAKWLEDDGGIGA